MTRAIINPTDWETAVADVASLPHAVKSRVLDSLEEHATDNRALGFVDRVEQSSEEARVNVYGVDCNCPPMIVFVETNHALTMIRRHPNDGGPTRTRVTKRLDHSDARTQGTAYRYGVDFADPRWDLVACACGRVYRFNEGDFFPALSEAYLNEDILHTPMRREPENAFDFEGDGGAI